MELIVHKVLTAKSKFYQTRIRFHLYKKKKYIQKLDDESFSYVQQK